MPDDVWVPGNGRSDDRREAHHLYPERDSGYRDDRRGPPRFRDRRDNYRGRGDVGGRLAHKYLKTLKRRARHLNERIRIDDSLSYDKAEVAALNWAIGELERKYGSDRDTRYDSRDRSSYGPPRREHRYFPDDR